MMNRVEFQIQVRGFSVADLAKAMNNAVSEASMLYRALVVRHFNDYQFQITELGFPPPKTPAVRQRIEGTGGALLKDTGEMSRETFVRLEKAGPPEWILGIGTGVEYGRHHVYGAPGAGIPQRDPYTPTEDEQREIETLITEHLAGL